MHYGILSDVHGKPEHLRAGLADMRRRGVEQVLFLGDIGCDVCFDLLCAAGAIGVFGNWEVSSWKKLRDGHRGYVASLPACLAEADFLAAHAAPFAPDGLHSLMGYSQAVMQPGRAWRTIFPYLNESEDALWKSFAELEQRGRRILFHGHTHCQGGWRMDASGRLTELAGPRLELGVAAGDANRYVIGVGSLGAPEDGRLGAYTCYDSTAGSVEWVRVPEQTPMG